MSTVGCGRHSCRGLLLPGSWKEGWGRVSPNVLFFCSVSVGCLLLAIDFGLVLSAGVWTVGGLVWSVAVEGF